MSHLKLPVPLWLDKTYIESALQKYLNKPNLKVKNMEITPGSKEGDNYVCQILRIKLLLDNDGDLSNLSLIGKLKPNSDTTKAMADKIDVFGVEAIFFEEVLPAVKKAVKGNAAAKKFAPECYHLDKGNCLLLMEDLGEKNLVMQPRDQHLNKSQTLLAMEALATLHGATYRVVEKRPDFKKTFELGVFGSKPSKFAELWFNGIKVLEKSVHSYGFSEDWCRRMDDLRKRLKDECIKACDFNEGRLNLIRHGDCWRNNFLFHYTDGVPDDIMLLDYQALTYNSFSHDLHYFLYSSVDADILVNDLDHLLETYYLKLKAVAPEIPNLTFERVKNEFHETLFFGCVMVIMFRAFIYSPHAPDLEVFINGQLDEMGFCDPKYIKDLKKLLPYMEQAGVF